MKNYFDYFLHFVHALTVNTFIIMCVCVCVYVMINFQEIIKEFNSSDSLRSCKYILPNFGQIVKTPTPTQHNTTVGFDMKITVQTTQPHPPTETFQPLLDQLESGNLAQIFTRPI